MNVTKDQLDKFERIIREHIVNSNYDVAFKHRIGGACDETDISVLDKNINMEWLRRYHVLWKNVKSLTDAAVTVIVDIEREKDRKKAEFDRYVTYDIELTKSVINSTRKVPEIKNVIFNGPATIVLWVDGTKTVVKCQEGDEFDPEKGLAMAISKKALGNKGSYYNTFTKWGCEEVDVDYEGYLKAFLSRLSSGLNK